MRDFQKQQSTLSDAHRSARRQNITGKLRRIRPGAATSLSAVQATDGQVLIDPDSMAAELQRHWSQTFAGEPIDHAALSIWLRHTLPDGGTGRDGSPLPSADVWRIRRHDVAKAVRLSGNSAPGPDGIPYLAWRMVGPLGVDVLWDVVRALATDEGSRMMAEAYSDLPPGEHSYNLGLLCCLPKKPSGHSADGTPYYTADHTRPLSIVNCDNRLVASAMRIRWESILDKWVSDFQRGFLPGRSMLSNIVDIDLHSMLVTLKHEHGALVLFDFSAAFPSVSHDFIFATLKHIVRHGGELQAQRRPWPQRATFQHCLRWFVPRVRSFGWARSKPKI